MMKAIVIADTHGNIGDFENIMNANPDADTVIHLGDGEREYEVIQNRFPDKNYRYVCGNNDYGGWTDEQVFDYGGVMVFITHGHRYNVRANSSLIVSAAHINKCTVALYGHSHVCDISEVNGVMLMNPGSTTYPRGGNPPSYGILRVENGKAGMSIIYLR